MDILLDTHALLWFMDGNEKMPAEVREAIHCTDNKVHVSIASIWEIAIKYS